jgi:hypothetical protein
MNKKNLMKKISVALSAFLVACSSFAFSACDDKPKRAFVEKPEEFEFGISWFPAFTDGAFSLIAECGIDFVILNEYQCGDLSQRGENFFTRDVIELAAKYGMKSIPHLRNAGLSDQFEGYGDLYIDDYYSSNENIDFVAVFDEPWYKHIEGIGEEVARFESQYKDKVFWVNLFPEYVVGAGINTNELGGKSYAQYIKHFCDTVLKKVTGERWLTLDAYPYLWNESSQTNGGLEPTWLHTMEIIAENAKEVGNCHVMAHLQTCSYKDHREPTLADMRQQTWVNMAFGAERLACYDYAKPQGHELHGPDKISMVDDDGKPTHIYYSVQQVIKDVKAMDDIYFQYQYDGMKGFLANERYEETLSSSDGYRAFNRLEKQLDKFERIDSVYCTQDTVISQFFDRNEKFAYIAVNYSDPIDGRTDDMLIEFDNVKSVKIVRFGKEVETVQVKNNVLSLSLAAGDGCMIIPQ